MPIGNAAAEAALELEKVRRKLPQLFALEATFFNKVNERTKKDKVSYRPERIPFQVSNGVLGQAVNLDGGDMGLGGAPQFTYGSLAPVQFDWALQWTAQAQIATDSGEKSVADYAKMILKAQLEAAQNDLDSIIEFGDGANTIGLVTSYDSVNLIVYVDNATRFRQGANYDLYNGGPGTSVTATINVKGIDYDNKALYLTAAPGTAPTAGAYLIFSNSTGVAGSGLNGFTSLQSTSTTGTYLGVSKSNFPGNFVTPSVNAGGATITPALARQLLNKLIIAAGVKTEDMSGYLLHTGLDQQAAWESAGFGITSILQSGDATGHDLLAKKPVQTLGGIPILATRKSMPGRMDIVDLSTWFVTEVQELDYYSAGSVETFWPMGASGGIAASFLKYMIWVGNIGCDNPKKNAVLLNLAVPSGY